MTQQEETIAQAAQAISQATHMLIGAGAGMGVDSGLPDFRGDEGFWRAYPPLRHLGIGFSDMANPRWFDQDPTLAWGFYGHRLHLYRDTIPHEGFAILLRWAQARDVFIFTSNVDGQFQKAGFDPERICEVHGSIHHLQCTRPCSHEIWSAQGTEVEVDPVTFRAVGDLPTCPSCGALARPNILMFGDGGWLHQRSEIQRERQRGFMERARRESVVAVELGAGRAIPTVRSESEWVLRMGGAHVRINPREPQGTTRTLSLAMGGLAALEAIDALVSQRTHAGSK